MNVYSGGCLCGEVRYEVNDSPVHVFYCHCMDCQKETGGPFATEIFLRQESLMISGKMHAFDVVGDSGKKVTRMFCDSCGCPILTKFENDPEHVCIKACSLDDARGLKPQFHLYVKSRQPWYEIADGLPQYQGDMEW